MQSAVDSLVQSARRFKPDTPAVARVRGIARGEAGTSDAFRNVMAYHQSSAALQLPITPPSRPDLRKRAVLLYCRPDGDFSFQDSQLEWLRDKYGRSLRIEISNPTVAARRCGAWVSATQPTFLLLHRSEIVAAAIGRLSTRELERIVERALD